MSRSFFSATSNQQTNPGRGSDRGSLFALTQITAILRPCLTELVLDTHGGWSKIMDLLPCYQAFFSPDSRLWCFRGLDIVNSPRRSYYDHNQRIAGARTISPSHRAIYSRPGRAQPQSANPARISLRFVPTCWLAPFR